MLFFIIYTVRNANTLRHPTSQALGFLSVDYANLIKHLGIFIQPPVSVTDK